MRFLAKADVQDLGLQPEALFAMALNNLFARLPGKDRRGKAGVMIVPSACNTGEGGEALSGLVSLT